MPLQLKLLGGARIESDGALLRGRAAHRRRLGLLALLAAARGRFLGREKIIHYLWGPDAREDAARHSLSEALYILRKELGEHVLLSNGDELALNPEVLECDLVVFRQAIAARDFERAVNAYGGHLLEGFNIDDAPEFERWAEEERAEAKRELGRALEALAEAAEAAGEMHAAADWWTRLDYHERHSSRVVLRLMRALVAAGERARAIVVGEAFMARIRAEMEMEPDREIREMVERLRREAAEARPTPAPAPPPPPAPVASPPPPASAPEGEPDLSSLAAEFEVLRPIGEGSMALVYLAREILPGRLVAIKVLARRYVDDRTAQLRFEREARAAAGIAHPYVVPVHRVGRLPSGERYLVMQYVSGGTLEDRIAAFGPFPLAEARRVIGQTAAGLAAAHRLGIVHRDVRPANILYDRDTDRVLITDFGIVAVLESGQERMLRLTLAGETLGTPAYSSPEQLRGEQVTERADVYSLGIVAFELLTGRLPFDGRTPLELTLAHARQEPHRVSAFRKEVDAELDDLVHRCLAKRPERRPFAADIADTLL